MTFDEFVRTPVQAPEKTSKMRDLIPRFEIGMSNEHSIASMCRWLSENSDDFRGMQPEKIYRLYLQVRKKTATRAKPSKAAKPAPAPIPLPASAVAPPQSDIVQKAPAPAQPPSNIPTSVQVSDYRKAGEAAKERLKALGGEAADWAEPQGFFLRQDNDVMSEWMRLEPGRREMIVDLTRAALRGIESAKANDPDYPDWLICNSYLSKGYSPRATTAKMRASKERAEAQKSPALRIFSGS